MNGINTRVLVVPFKYLKHKQNYRCWYCKIVAVENDTSKQNQGV